MVMVVATVCFELREGIEFDSPITDQLISDELRDLLEDERAGLADYDSVCINAIKIIKD